MITGRPRGQRIVIMAIWPCRGRIAMITKPGRAKCRVPRRGTPLPADRDRACQRGGPAAGGALVTFVFMFESASVLDGLNDEQRAAAAHPGGPLLVLAGAGTGKTRTLVARAAWLCEQGVPPSRILLLTFTRRAADDMLSRAIACARPANANGRPTGGRITGGTFHAIAHRIIRQH